MNHQQGLERELAILEDDLRRAGVRLGQLRAELAQLGQDSAPPEGLDFEAVKQCAANLPFHGHPLAAERNPQLTELYLIALLKLAHWRPGTDLNLLVFCQWLLTQSRGKKPLSRLLAESYAADHTLFGQLRRQLKEELMPVFLLDLMIASSLSGPAHTGALDYICEWGSCLRCGEELFSALAVASQAVLRQSAGGLSREEVLILLDRPSLCRYYLPQAIWGELLASLRRVVVRSEEPGNVEWKKGQGLPVAEDEPVARLLSASSKKSRARTVKADCSGYFFHFVDRGVAYGVIAGGGDQKDSIKNWVRRNKL